ncbi:hypothetical protein SSP35_05_03050 [Streptomyces sp. NBRC 110611]|uniref:imidazolonepropionase-like domain-containing protein n=1 Tax=Streptomyces sp. NBRC 110611 TaxID=1621259 RepID=UPI000834B1DD|nr:hypothetical protein [Streptomyces sp. NBRC 110611]GAU67738.1 hypothetical protein SSP35_05_03050 [Streptomyces sp. NBRC 110611]
MLTIHRVRGVRRVHEGPLDPGHAVQAVVVDGARIAAIGPYEELAATYGLSVDDAEDVEGAEDAGDAGDAGEESTVRGRVRLREWDGVLTPGRHEPDGRAFLEAAYHPDPREADELGTEPITGEALAALGMTEMRWGASARRGLQRLLASGTTALTGPFTRPAVRTAVQRSGLDVLSDPGSGSSPDPGSSSGLGSGPGPRALAPGGVATFAVFADDGTALATVLAGRLVHRRPRPASPSPPFRHSL